MIAFLICPDETLRKQFEAAAAPYANFGSTKVLTEYPSPDALARWVRAWAPEVVFMSLENTVAAETLSRLLETDFPAIRRIAVHSAQTSEAVRCALRLQIPDLLAAPFDSGQIGQALDLVARHVEFQPAVESPGPVFRTSTIWSSLRAGSTAAAS
jgi:DNA-binding NarL/FixJ family response regulator